MLFHETSLKNALSIVRSKLICGARFAPPSVESYPHFVIDRSQLGQNTLEAGGGRVLLIFEHDMVQRSLISGELPIGNETDTVLDMYGNQENYSQSIIIPPSRSITLIAYEIQGDDDLTMLDRMVLNRAVRVRTEVYPALLPNVNVWYRRNGGSFRFLLHRLTGGLL